MTPALRLTSERRIVLGLAALAVIVRLWGIGFGLPQVYHVDEAWFGAKAIGYFTGDLNPHFWHVPSLYTYLVAAVWSVYFLLGKAFGSFTTAASFIAAYGRDATVFLILGRLLTAAFSWGTIALLYRLGRRMYGPAAGALAALFLIFSPEHNRISHYMNPDSPMVFFLVLALYFIWRVYEDGRTRDYLLAGIAAGLAFATKYGGPPMFLPLFLAHIFHIRRKGLPAWRIFLHPPLIASGLLCLAVFVAACPYAVLDYSKFAADFRWQSEHLAQAGHYGSSTEVPAGLFYLRYGFRENAGPLVQFLVAGGVLLALLRLRKREVLLLAFPLLILVFISLWKTYATRYLLPAAPFFLLSGAWFFIQAAGFAGQAAARLRPKLKTAVAAALLALILLPSVSKAYRFDWSLAHKDTRTEASEWLVANLPENSRLAYEAYCPPLPEGRFRTYSRQPSLGVVDIDWLAWRRVEYVIVSELEYGRFLPYPEEFPQAKFYSALEQTAVLVKEFVPRYREDLLTMHNPVIRVYRLGQALDPRFPGNFARYAQAVTIFRTDGGRSILKSAVRASGSQAKDELVSRPYVRVLDPSGKEVARLDLLVDEGAGRGRLEAEGTGAAFVCPPHAQVLVGYAYAFASPPGFWRTPPDLAKEAVLIKAVPEADLKKPRVDAFFVYGAFPGTQGDRHVQSARITRAGAGWRLEGALLGGKLRWGPDRVLNPYVRVLDAAGAEAAKILLFPGWADAREAARVGPFRTGALMSALPAEARVAFGYDAYRTGTPPEREGGPFAFEIPLLRLEEPGR